MNTNCKEEPRIHYDDFELKNNKLHIQFARLSMNILGCFSPPNQFTWIILMYV